jgi:hypothetical protein
MANEQKKQAAPQASPLPDIVGIILGPLQTKPAPAVKQKPSPRDKQFRGGKNKGQ